MLAKAPTGPDVGGLGVFPARRLQIKSTKPSFSCEEFGVFPMESHPNASQTRFSSLQKHQKLSKFIVPFGDTSRLAKRYINRCLRAPCAPFPR